MSLSDQSWTGRLFDGFARCFIGAISIVVRPKISKAEALAIVRSAAAARNWAIGEPTLIDRVTSCYLGIGFIEGTEIAVIWLVDGRSGEVLQLQRSDEMSDPEPPATQS
jgi:hypothetical protein